MLRALSQGLWPVLGLAQAEAVVWLQLRMVIWKKPGDGPAVDSGEGTVGKAAALVGSRASGRRGQQASRPADQAGRSSWARLLPPSETSPEARLSQTSTS